MILEAVELSNMMEHALNSPMLSKKTILALLPLLPALLYAEWNLFSYQLGYSSSSITHDRSIGTGGFYNGVDFLSTSASGFGKSRNWIWSHQKCR